MDRFSSMQRTADAARRRDANQQRGTRRRNADQATDLDELASRIGLGGSPPRRSWWPWSKRSPLAPELNLSTPAAAVRPSRPPVAQRPPAQPRANRAPAGQRPIPPQLTPPPGADPDILPAALVQPLVPPPGRRAGTPSEAPPASAPFIPRPIGPPPTSSPRRRASRPKPTPARQRKRSVNLVAFGLVALLYFGHFILDRLH